MKLSDIKELALRAKEMAEKATKGPWTRRPVSVRYPRATNRQDNHNWNLIDGMETCAGEAHRGTAPYPDPFYIALPDAEFIASSRTVVPELADAVLKLLEDNERLREQRPSILLDAFKARDRAIAENAKLRAALRYIANYNLEGMDPNNVYFRKCIVDARAALEGTP
jgi:hypothetical protein